MKTIIAGPDEAVAGSAAPSMRWALARPQRIARVVLVATTPRFIAGDDWPYAMSADTLTRFGDELRRFRFLRS